MGKSLGTRERGAEVRGITDIRCRAHKVEELRCGGVLMGQLLLLWGDDLRALVVSLKSHHAAVLG